MLHAVKLIFIILVSSMLPKVFCICMHDDTETDFSTSRLAF